MTGKFIQESHPRVQVLNLKGLFPYSNPQPKEGVQASPQSTSCLPGHIPKPMSLRPLLKSPLSPELQVLLHHHNHRQVPYAPELSPEGGAHSCPPGTVAVVLIEEKGRKNKLRFVRLPRV